MRFIIIFASIFITFPTVGAFGDSENLVQGLSVGISLPVGFKNYGYGVVEAKKGHPVRSGKKSMRFEVRAGDCSSTKNGSWSDCRQDRERHELKQESPGTAKGEYWYHWSIYFPNDFQPVYPVKVALGQFKLGQNDSISGPPMFMFQNKDGGYYVDNQTIGETFEKIKILSHHEVIGKWSDILINVNWTTEQDGFFTVYVNGETSPRYHWVGRTVLPKQGDRLYYKFGIYRSFVSRRPGPEPTQVIYYDDVAIGSRCKNVTNYFNCKKIMSLRSNIKVISNEVKGTITMGVEGLFDDFTTEVELEPANDDKDGWQFAFVIPDEFIACSGKANFKGAGYWEIGCERTFFSTGIAEQVSGKQDFVGVGATESNEKINFEVKF